jgi:hypothetical protein
MDPDVEISSRFIGQGAYHGHDGVHHYWQNSSARSPTRRSRFRRRRTSEGWVLIAVPVRGHGTGSDAPFDEAAWVTARVQDGTCVWWRAHSTEVEGLEAAGLRE